MKIKRLLALGIVAWSAGTFAAGDHQHAQEHKAAHGGVLAKASDLDFELVAKASAVTLYVTDHGKPASTQGASGKLTVLTGAEKTEVPLLPAGGNMLEAKGNFKISAGSKLVATVVLRGGKPVNVRFALK